MFTLLRQNDHHLYKISTFYLATVQIGTLQFRFMPRRTVIPMETLRRVRNCSNNPLSEPRRKVLSANRLRRVLGPKHDR